MSDSLIKNNFFKPWMKKKYFRLYDMPQEAPNSDINWKLDGTIDLN